MKKTVFTLFIILISLLGLSVLTAAQGDICADLYAYPDGEMSITVKGAAGEWLSFDENAFSLGENSEGRVLVDGDTTLVFSVDKNAAFKTYEFSLSDGKKAFCAVVEKTVNGDCDLDGKVTTSDVRYILKAAVGLTQFGKTQTQNVDEASSAAARNTLLSAIEKPTLSELSVACLPTKTEYSEGESFLADGGFLFAEYENKKTELVPLSKAQISGFSSENRGQSLVTAEYAEGTTQFYTTLENTRFSADADTYGDGSSFNYLCGVDMYGRAFMPVSGLDSEKDVGIFYFTATNPTNQTQIYDITQLLSEGKENEVLYSAVGFGMVYFWGKPLFGYYRSGETYVMNRHVEMLSAAGVDYMLFDVTNALVYRSEAFNMLSCLRSYKDAGFDVPQVGFYTHFSSSSTMDEIYDFLYSNSIYTAKYGDLYYAPNGKPFIVGDYPSERVAQNMDVRPSYWPQQGEWGTLDDYGYQGFPWIEWVFEPYLHADNTVCVSVAQHRNGAFSFKPISDATAYPREGDNWGRGCDAQQNRNADSYGLGQNFQRQWDNAIDLGATQVFITGWNEWTVSKNNSVDAGGVIYFCDQYNAEFSRDIEPVTGGFEDSFYLQLISNIRRYKGLSENMQKPEMTNASGTDLSVWDSVKSVYKNIQFETYRRLSAPVCGKMPTEDFDLYRIAKAANNITEVRVTHDENNLYFLVTASENIVANTSEAMRSPERWMNLFLSVGEVKAQGFEGYKYVVNRTADSLSSGQSGNGSICFLNADGTAGKQVGTADLYLENNKLRISVPLSAIGSDGGETGIYFKVADNITNYTDICNYYVTGKSFPLGRLSLYYYF